MKIPGQLGKQTANFRRSRPRLLERQWKSRFRIGSPRPRSGSRFLPPIAAATPSANRCPPAAAATAEGSRKVHGSLRKATEGYRSLRKVGLVPTLGPAHPFQAFSRVSKGYQAIIFIVPASNQNSKTKNQTFYDDFRLQVLRSAFDEGG